MIYLRSIKIEQVWEHAGIDWRQASLSPVPSIQPVWSLATPVRDQKASAAESRFFKSLDDECNAVDKKSSLMVMLGQLRGAVYQADYQAFLKDSNVQVKEAHKFTYRGSKHKVWELKYQKKDRIYFFSHQEPGTDGKKYLIPLLFHHKKDQNTPSSITNSCESMMKPFLDPSPTIVFIKE